MTSSGGAPGWRNVNVSRAKIDTRDRRSSHGGTVKETANEAGATGTGNAGAASGGAPIAVRFESRSVRGAHSRLSYTCGLE